MRAASLAATTLTVALFAGGCAYVGELAVSPHRSRVGPPPADLGAETVTVPVPAREPLAGWFVEAADGAPAVVLLHGHTDDRRQMLGRARFLADAGYAVLMVDLPAHGESGGDRVTFGYRERHAASAAVDFVRHRRPRTKVGVLGISLGAAAAALAGEHLDADALVLDQSFATFDATVRARADRLFGRYSGPVEAMLLGQVRPQLGVPPDSLRPAVALARTDQPTLVIGGSADRWAPPRSQLALYRAAPAPKAVWMVADAAHEDLLAVVPEEYPARVLAFFDAHLR